MVRGVRLEPGGDLAHAEHIGEEARQLMGAIGKRLRPCVPVGAGGEQPGIVLAQHPGAGPGRRDDVVEGFERLDGAFRDGPRIAGIAAVVGRLSAARLGGGHADGATRVLEQLHRREPDGGTEEIDETGDEQADPRAGGHVVVRISAVRLHDGIRSLPVNSRTGCRASHEQVPCARAHCIVKSCAGLDTFVRRVGYRAPDVASGDFRRVSGTEVMTRLPERELSLQLSQVLHALPGTAPHALLVHTCRDDRYAVRVTHSLEWNRLVMSYRTATIERNTRETRITATVALDGSGAARLATGIPFFEHMLEQVARHGAIDLEVRAEGDIAVDDHHTVEDTGIVLGQAVAEALGDKRGIFRYGHAYVPLDEALSRVVIDFSGRPGLFYRVSYPRARIGAFDVDLIREFFQGFANAAAATVHIDSLHGVNAHHVAETVFKAFGRALRMAVAPDERMGGTVPSTKGVL